MKNNPSEFQKRNPYAEIESIANGYRFDEGSGLYKPISCQSDGNKEKVASNNYGSNLLHVEVRRDWLTLAVSVISLVVVSIYAVITYQLWQEAQVTVNQTQQELAIAQLQAVTSNIGTTTARQQVIATQAAVLSLDPRPIGDMNQEISDFLISLQNNSHAVASKIHAIIHIQKIFAGDQMAYWESPPIVITADQLLPTEEGHNTIERHFPVTLSIKERKMFNDTDITFGIKGLVEYWNGFEMTHADLCIIEFRYEFKDKAGKDVGGGGGQFVPCGEFMATMPGIEETKKEWRQKYHQ
jgi:hypothetical protein